jgi:hypothetical protein
MAAPKGNQFWKIAAARIGRPLSFRTPADLWAACCEYFAWVDKHPLHEAQAFAYQGRVTLKSLPKMRAMTIGALCLYLGVEEKTWRNYRGRKDFLPVITRAESIIRAQKFEGAAAELLSPTIIARDLGLADKTVLDGKVETGAHEALAVVSAALDGIASRMTAKGADSKKA